MMLSLLSTPQPVDHLVSLSKTAEEKIHEEHQEIQDLKEILSLLQHLVARTKIKLNLDNITPAPELNHVRYTELRSPNAEPRTGNPSLDPGVRQR